MNVHERRAAPVTLDPITVEVIGAALTSIVEETGEALVRASYSTNIKERRDCSTALFNTKGETLCQAEHIPLHLGSFIGIIPKILELHDVAGMQPGDVFVGNDAYMGGGTHLPDIVLAEPIFVDGEIAAWTVNLAHHADFADRGHAHIYQEGLRIPPIRLYRAGELQKDVLDLILLNCQVPRERLSDLRAQMAANRVGVQRFQDLCGKWGTETVLAAGDALLAYAERKMRAGIAALKDGVHTFSDVFDGPEFDTTLPLSVTLTVKGEEMTVSFEAPPQQRAGINMTWTALAATVYYIVKAVVDPTVPPNAGLARPIKVEAPRGSLLNCIHPAAVNGRVQLCQRVADLTLGALYGAAPDKVTACTNSACCVATFTGQRKADGSIWVYLETFGGGGGARPTKDGLDGIHVHVTNTSNLPVEALEVEYPLTVLRYELVNGSAGEGRFCGGMGLKRVVRAEEDCLVRVDVSRTMSRSWGLEGGGEGGHGKLELGPTVAPFDRDRGVLKTGDWFALSTPGGGGFGPEAERTAELKEADRLDGIGSASS